MRRITAEKMRELADEELSKLYAHVMTQTWKWITADEQLEKGPGILSYIVLTAKNNPCTLTMHDGIGTSGKIICIIETTAAQSRPYAFHDRLLFSHGLYVNLSGDVEGVLVVWHPLPHGITQG